MAASSSTAICRELEASHDVKSTQFHLSGGVSLSDKWLLWGPVPLVWCRPFAAFLEAAPLILLKDSLENDLSSCQIKLRISCTLHVFEVRVILLRRYRNHGRQAFAGGLHQGRRPASGGPGLSRQTRCPDRDRFHADRSNREISEIS